MAFPGKPRERRPDDSGVKPAFFSPAAEDADSGITPNPHPKSRPSPAQHSVIDHIEVVCQAARCSRCQKRSTNYRIYFVSGRCYRYCWKCMPSAAAGLLKGLDR